jgi:hypothetical protein
MRRGPCLTISTTNDAVSFSVAANCSSIPVGSHRRFFS